MRQAAALLATVALLGAAAQPSAKLVEILTTISHFDDASLIAISYWASASNPQAPDVELTDLDRVQTESLQLAPAERDALFTWLNHGGRDKLYAVGASDAQIGQCQKLIDEKSCAGAQGQTVAAPGLATAGSHGLALHLTPSDPSSGVELEGGFAAVSGASILTDCIGFKNTSTKTAAAITFTYQILDPNGSVLEAGSDIVVGSFTPGAVVTAPDPSAANGWSGSGGTSPQPSNCWVKASGQSDPALSSGSGFAVEVASVTYEDGTHWSL